MKRTKFTAAFLAVLLAIFAALSFADEAAAKPNWVTVKYTGSALRKNKDRKLEDGNYYSLVLKFDIINNSNSGEILTAIYNRKISWNGVFTIPDVGSRHEQLRHDVKYSMNGKEPYKGEWYPQEVYKYEHSVPLNRIITQPYYGWEVYNKGLKEGYKFKLDKWSLDFQVRSKK
ncbi:MAG: hypothetical protein LBS35_07450 [Synergistaceae bacterium]|jgi:hypothetical protein|nr:hypothetical protein [Synergistaceae bacterium]